MRRFFVSALVFVGLWSVVLGEAAKDQHILKLQLAVCDVFCKQTACSCAHGVANREYADFLDALKRDYGIELSLVYFPEPYILEKEMLVGKYDGAIAKPWILLRHQEGRGARLERLADLQDTGKNPWLWGQIIVLKESPIHSLREALGGRLVLGEDDGYEKNQSVLQLLGREKLAWPKEKILTRASCLEALDLLLKHEADVVAISNYALVADCGVDVATPDQFRVIAETEKIPLTSLMLDTTKIAPADRERLKDAVLSLSAKALPPSMGGGFVKAAPWAPEQNESKR